MYFRNYFFYVRIMRRRDCILVPLVRHPQQNRLFPGNSARSVMQETGNYWPDIRLLIKPESFLWSRMYEDSQ
jgi:hypothetical protein